MIKRDYSDPEVRDSLLIASAALARHKACDNCGKGGRLIKLCFGERSPTRHLCAGCYGRLDFEELRP